MCKKRELANVRKIIILRNKTFVYFPNNQSRKKVYLRFALIFQQTCDESDFLQMMRLFFVNQIEKPQSISKKDQKEKFYPLRYYTKH